MLLFNKSTPHPLFGWFWSICDRFWCWSAHPEGTLNGNHKLHPPVSHDVTHSFCAPSKQPSLFCLTLLSQTTESSTGLKCVMLSGETDEWNTVNTYTNPGVWTNRTSESFGTEAENKFLFGIRLCLVEGFLTWRAEALGNVCLELLIIVFHCW